MLIHSLQSLYKVPRLVKGTVPLIFPWTEEDILSKTTTPLQAHKDSAYNSDGCPLPQKRKKGHDGNKENEENNTTILSLVKLQHQGEIECPEIQEPLDCQKNGDQIDCQETVATPVSPRIEGENTSSVSLTFGQLLATEIKLPHGWLMQSTRNKNMYTCIKISYLFLRIPTQTF